MSKTNEMRQALQEFHQKPDEQFYEAWDRFQDLIINCPHHGLEKNRLVQSFYNGLTSSSRNMIESMHKGKFMNLTPTPAYEFLSELGEDSQQWDANSEMSRNEPQLRKRGLYEVKQDPNLQTLINGLSILNKTVESLTCSIKQSVSPIDPVMSVGTTSNLGPCNFCLSDTHTSSHCPITQNYSDGQEEEVYAFSTYRKPTPASFSQTYNPELRNHPNFSWRQGQSSIPPRP